MNLSVRCLNRWVMVSMGVILLAGCAGMKTTGSTTASSRKPLPDSATMGWRSVRFQNDWPEGGPAEWHIDALIAHRVVTPVLDRYRDQIPLWRVHRRAAHDSTGHLFSFIFYTDSASALRVTDAIRNNSLVIEMMQYGIVQRVFTDGADQTAKPTIEDTSDQSWSPVVRHTWPYFIMGVSKTWLEMIDVEAGRQPSSTVPSPIEDLEDLIERYRRIDNQVRHAWQYEGRHAFLHHLNAVFGYAPVSMGKDLLMKF